MPFDGISMQILFLRIFFSFNSIGTGEAVHGFLYLMTVNLSHFTKVLFELPGELKKSLNYEEKSQLDLTIKREFYNLFVVIC